MNAVFAAVVLAVVAISSVAGLFNLARSDQARSKYRQTVRAMRWWMIPAALGQLSAVTIMYLAIVKLVPALSFGWWRLVSGGPGNIMLGQTGQTGAAWRIAALTLPIVLFAVVPLEAHREEEMFRSGAEKQSIGKRLRTQMLFGVIHCAMGIPIAAGIALSISGAYFLTVYLQAARHLRPEFAAAEEIPGPERLPYPELPALTAYDSEAFEAYDREWDRVRAENRRRLDQWLDDLPNQAAASVERINRIRRRPVAKAAAAHAVSNWLVIATVVIAVIVSSLA
ncbi:hypothetical protein AAHS21_19825 [Mycobacterium sp. 050272]|uniref:hypothetical protein n=1 Tax=Mycobacterium sp. 050272 TaxID=3142488 RepID=UPI0031912C62